MIVLIDNYDSFAYNLARYLARLATAVSVLRNDEVDVAAVRNMRPQAIVLSPGPCTPTEAGCSLDLVRACWQEFPILGVCLGHQTIAAAFGARIVRAPQPMHGKTSRVFHDGTGVFHNAPHPLSACRYHSLVVDRTSLSSDLAVTATTCDGVIMALQHVHRPIVGLQFHPESILTEFGYGLLANFLHLAGISTRVPIPELGDELISPVAPSAESPGVPVTF